MNLEVEGFGQMIAVGAGIITCVGAFFFSGFVSGGLEQAAEKAG